MTDHPHATNDFCNLPQKMVQILTAAQRKLLDERKARGVPVDGRSVANLVRLEGLSIYHG